MFNRLQSYAINICEKCGLGLLCVGFLLGGCTQSDAYHNQPPPVLLISFDGFRYDYLSKTNTPNFDRFASEGVRAKGLIPVFPSKTFPNHYSIATGLYPENSGIIANTMFDPGMQQWYRISDRNAVEDNRWYSGEPIWNTAEKQGLRAGTMFWVGSESDIQGMHPTHWKTYDGSMPFRARIDTVVKWMSGEEPVNFGTLYFEHVDKMGHCYGTESDSLVMAIEQSDQLLGYLEEKLREQELWEKTNIIVVSDHGMMDLAADKIITLDTLIDLDDLKRVVWAPVTMMQPKAGKEQSLYDALKKQEDHYKIFKKNLMPDRYHLKNNSRVPDLIMVAEPGYAILEQKYKSRFIQSLPRATHGYEPGVKKMQAFFLARGPAFKDGRRVDSFQNIHLYELMAELLDIKPAPNDGSLDSVRVTLKKQ